MKFLLMVTMVTVSFAADESVWSYADQEAWGGVCNKGTRESPIDIKGADKIMAYTEKIELPAKLEIELQTDGLKTVKLNILDETSNAVFKMPDTWPVGHTKGLQALQLHLHWGRKGEKGSEHYLFGEQYDGEAHLVCRNLDQEDETAGDAYAVFGIFLQVDVEPEAGSDHLQQILDGGSTAFYLPRIYTENDQLTSMFTYEGGLTTPGCNEAVYWHVTPYPLYVSAVLMEKLRSFGGEEYYLNYRELQPLNERKVIARVMDAPYATPQEDDSHCEMDCYAAEQKCKWGNTGAAIFPSISLLLIAIFSLL